MTSRHDDVDACAEALRPDFLAIAERAAGPDRPAAQVARDLQQIADKLKGMLSNFGSRLSLTDLESELMRLAEKYAGEEWTIETVAEAIERVADAHAAAVDTED
ncbi:hypothetical protein [Oricola cellulosilytica]|uniref:Uncharacterized protein n=1 Tax=Oricola cellulosilytica TaxID=1429082 RepID=A0A4R0PE27_9HYPH|nr:hypothetical protein [Oricola cellulosilytica]TCD13496.1 hypothetical protein E0D97_13570 [Oricola cellulosilytica]